MYMIRVTDSFVHDRVERTHRRGQLYFTDNEKVRDFYKEKRKLVIVGADVQQTTIYANAVQFAEGGDHAIIDWCHVMTWDELEAFADRHGAVLILPDYGYARRQLEVLRECLARGQGWIPCKGFDRKTMNLPYKQTILDPWEGTGQQSSESAVLTYSWLNDIFKMEALDCLKGNSNKKLIMYQDPEAQLVNQLASEERVEGEWQVMSDRMGYLSTNRVGEVALAIGVAAMERPEYWSARLDGVTDEEIAKYIIDGLKARKAKR